MFQIVTRVRIMTSLPYVGLDEINNDKIGTLKALFAECLGTGLLVKNENSQSEILYLRSYFDKIALELDLLLFNVVFITSGRPLNMTTDELSC